MYLFHITVFITTCICLTNAFGIYGFLNTYGLFLKELTDTLDLFDAASTSTKWIEQPLDHFDENENRTWYMRYFERLDYWKAEGPIYLFINGEAQASDALLRTGILYELAKETNGAMYASEHRYYGKSQPFEEMSTENFAYLSSRQALADVAKLLQEIKSLPQYKESKVVVVGGSYAGNLAAWMKLLYPDLIDAAIASSAPVLAKKDFYEYLESVSNDFEQHGTSGCHKRIGEVFNRYDELFKTDAGIEQLKKEEQICNSTDMNKPENKQLFFLDKAVQFMYEAQYGNVESIKNYCDGMKNNSLVFAFIDDEYDLWSQKTDCFNYDFDHMIENMRQVDWVMAWTYQTCTEFGYFMSTSSKKHPFTDNVPVDLYNTLCTKTYGPKFNEKRVEEGIKRTNDMYGGLTPNVTHVVFTNGDLDPWARLGILEDVSYDAPAKMIPRSSHCRDLFSNKAKDPEELKEARKYTKYLIKKWIGAGKYEKP
ncbi:putative serine protease K12H4.7 [Anticarsia gemmatalis]|uniref:putative serine protease K12H4.7 n=1 Tax=Anticarsia gemmatalis TaxID=129554 RepID=UPI003F776B36